MNSNPMKHTEPTSGNQQGAEDQNGPCSSSSLTGRTDSANMEKTALDIVTENLMEQIVDTDLIEGAWARVKANRGAPGPDGITIAKFPEYFQSYWPVIKQQLLDGTYKPGPVRRKTIRKEDGGERHLGIPNLIDRLIQQAILLVLGERRMKIYRTTDFQVRRKSRRTRMSVVHQAVARLTIKSIFLRIISER